MNDIYVDGPVYKIDECFAGDYVTSFVMPYKDSDSGQWKEWTYDLYMVTDGSGRQIAIYNDSDDGFYGSLDLNSLIFTSSISETSKAIISVLFDKGKLVWNKN